MTTISAAVLNDLAPTGVLRAAINLGNTVLAQTGADGAPKGVSVDLARALAQRLGVDVSFVIFDTAGKVFEALKSNVWDIAFLAIEPARATDIAFTAPYVLIEGRFIVRNESPLNAVADFDRPGVRIAVGKGAAYDLYLSRTFRHATLVREASSAAALQHFVDGGLEAGAGVGQSVQAFADANPGLRLIAERFMAIGQAMGTPKGREAGAAYLGQFVEEMKASGFVADALVRSGQSAALAAPPAAA
ncbi:MAG TPA: ABC transporter substrate-binding protein [Pseudolabrys sp.]|nr:ABC transporter substrate-binding protein [Pseudolabrys sp.]